MLPSLVEAQIVTSTACLRPLSADWMPIIGGVPGLANVYLATGHWMEGILLSPITAYIITELILGRSTNLFIDPFNPVRFS
jgi:glycine oxidase